MAGLWWPVAGHSRPMCAALQLQRSLRRWKDLRKDLHKEAPQRTPPLQKELLKDIPKDLFEKRKVI